MKKKFLLLVAPLLLIFACCHTQRDKKSDEYVEEKIIPEKTGMKVSDTAKWVLQISVTDQK